MVTRRPRRRLLARALPWFLLWLASRSAYFLFFASVDPSYRTAAEAGFGPALWMGEMLFAFLGTGAAVGLWMRWSQAVTLSLAAMALYASIAGFQLYLLERDPHRAKAAYVASREARRLPVRPERVEQMFSPRGRALTWTIGGLLCLAPLVILLRNRDYFTPSVGSRDER